MEAADKVDILIFGATGFTGKHVVETVAKWIASSSTKQGKDKDKNLKWGVAGRSVEKLRAVLEKAQKDTGYDTKDVKTFYADVDDQASLNVMASKCKVLLNTVGPYRFYGEQVVKACVEEGTNYVDVSGEPEFLERMQLKYHAEAEKKKIYIVGACGFDSIPTDCGVVWLQNLFHGNKLFTNTTSPESVKINHATWLSAVHGVANAKLLRSIRKDLYKKERPIPQPSHKLQYRGVLHENKTFGGYYLPFPGSDASVVRRSQRHLYYKDKIRPAQFGAYVKMGSIWRCLVMIIAAVIFGLLAQFKAGQNFLDKWASWLTFGYVTHEGPKDNEMKNVKFTIFIVGKGWGSKMLSPDDKHLDAPNITKTIKVTGENPGYGATCVMLLQAALVILEEKGRLPSEGGVYPPGAAFAKTNIIQRLNANGVKFEEVI